ncbi:hypothetical protein ACPCHT_20845 [Nucisporomicrobium flavum]|uniref:hypothetical protein n=1 Tax=Nucisporomicrobium flavum TaxID=2785915 RepID=UPI003C2FDB66
MIRHRIALTLTTAGLAGLLTLTGCGTPGAAPGADVADETTALRTVALQGEPSAAPGKPGEHRPGARRLLRKNTLHGEVAVQGKDGVRTIVVQRGTVTAADGRTVSVKSSDGFAQTWTLGDKLRVVQDKKKVAVDAVRTGATIGVAGRKDGDAAVARLIVIG